MSKGQVKDRLTFDVAGAHSSFLVPRSLENPAVDWEPYRRRIVALKPIRASGRVAQVVGLVVESEGPAAHLGDLCAIESARNDRPVLAEVVL